MNSELTLWGYRYVYMRTNTDSDDIEYMLNEMGGTVWELVNVISGTGGTPNDAKIHGYIFKKTNNRVII